MGTFSVWNNCLSCVTALWSETSHSTLTPAARAASTCLRASFSTDSTKNGFVAALSMTW
jgi:hypothetical protein